jgi:hypothetical protein
MINQRMVEEITGGGNSLKNKGITQNEQIFFRKPAKKSGKREKRVYQESQKWRIRIQAIKYRF